MAYIASLLTKIIIKRKDLTSDRCMSVNVITSHTSRSCGGGCGGGRDDSLHSFSGGGVCGIFLCEWCK